MSDPVPAAQPQTVGPGAAVKQSAMSAGGYAAWVIAMTLSLPIWAYGLAQILWLLIKNPRKFFYRKNRSLETYPDPVPGLEHEFAEINGVRLHLVIGGRSTSAKQKPLMLFLHGFPEMWYSWRHQMAEFMDEYQVVAYDHRGFGDSEKPPGRSHYAMTKLVDDVVGVIRQLGYEKCVLVGHDWGGTIAWRTAIWYPEVVEKLITCCGAHPELYFQNMDADQRKRSQYFWFIQCPVLPEIYLSANDFEQLDYHLMTGPMGARTQGAITTADLERYKQKLGQPNTLKAGLDYYRAAIDAATWNKLEPREQHRVECPCLVLWADSDTKMGVQLLKGIEDVVARPEVHILENASHWLQQDKWQEVNRLMKDFLAAHKRA